ncbi:MAG: ribokinase [Chloroflexi bacterium]|nr:ribokinase [Chloroflexota bacterium]
MGHIVVVGSVNMDLVVRAPHLPQPGETIIGSDFKTFPGGKGANQAVAAARLGGHVKMIGRVGNDAFGEELLRTLANDHVDTTFVQRDADTPSGVALITVEEAGQNTIVVASGANAKVTPDDVDRAEAAFDGASVLLLQLESPLPTVLHAIEVAKKHQVRVILNPAPSQPLNAQLLSLVDYLVPNQIELALLTQTQTIETGVHQLQSLGVKHVVVTLGGDGVAVFEDKQTDRLAAHPVKVVDTTAAGDAFVGGFAVALVEGKSTREAAEWGNAAGALAVTRAGAQPSLPTRAELERFIGHR